MRLTNTLLLTALLAVAMLTGCSGSKASSDNTTSAPAPVVWQAESVPILGKIGGINLDLTDYSLDVLEAAAIDELQLAPRFAEQGVVLDLDQHSVILFSLGEQPTAGYAADILALQLKGSELYVQGTAAAPKPDTAVAQQLTTPFCAVAVPKLPGNLTVRSDITSLVE